MGVIPCTGQRTVARSLVTGRCPAPAAGLSQVSRRVGRVGQKETGTDGAPSTVAELGLGGAPCADVFKPPTAITKHLMEYHQAGSMLGALGNDQMHRYIEMDS